MLSHGGWEECSRVVCTLRRRAFETVRGVTQRLVARLHDAAGESNAAALDIDGALQCQSFDVIGAVGFGHDFCATSDLRGPGAANCRTIKEGVCRPPSHTSPSPGRIGAATSQLQCMQTSSYASVSVCR